MQNKIQYPAVTEPPLSHLTSYTPTKSNLYQANYLAAAVSEPALYRLLIFHIPNLMSLFRCLGHTKVSIQLWCRSSCFVTKPVFMVRSCQRLTQPPSWKTTHCQVSATAYSIFLQLPSIFKAIPPSTTWGLTMPLWQGPTYHRCN